MAHALYLDDSYLTHFTSTVHSLEDEHHLVLEQTAFYPSSGGQPHDVGTLTSEGKTYQVMHVAKKGELIVHEISPAGLCAGSKVTGTIDWDRRYKLMRMHTAAHLLSQAIHEKTGALITGNQLGTESSRIDFSLEQYDPEQLKTYVAYANAVIQKDLPITHSYSSREEAALIPQVSKLAVGLPAHLHHLRILRIGDFDVQADGGTHVASTKEVGTILFQKCENKGKSNRRIYFTLTP